MKYKVEYIYSTHLASYSIQRTVQNVARAQFSLCLASALFGICARQFQWYGAGGSQLQRRVRDLSGKRRADSDRCSGTARPPERLEPVCDGDMGYTADLVPNQLISPSN